MPFETKPKQETVTMKSKEFICGLMAYIKEHYQHPDAVFLKEAPKFKRGKFVYGEITFSYSNVFEGVILRCHAYNKEMGAFFAENVPPYDEFDKPYDSVFSQGSFESSPYYHAPPITRYSESK